MNRDSLLPLLILCLLSRFPAVAGDRGEKMVDSLLRVMTLDEKVGQLVLYTPGRIDTRGGTPLSSEQVELLVRGGIGGIFNLTGADTTRAVQKIAVERSRLGIPLIFGLDVIHGYRTTFPIPLAEAATWDTSRVAADARVAAAEAASAGVNWTFAPMVDIARDPRWGRIAEGSGEDPLLGSVMAAARVRGFQGADPASAASVGACAKHFAAYGGGEGGRDYNTVDMSERTLREVYLPPYRAAVDAGALTVMSSFNEIGGVPSTENRALLTGVLKEEWGFGGFVVSDWTSVTELIPHGVARDTAAAAALALNAGTDMDMESGAYHFTLSRLVREGKVPLSRLDDAVRRVLRVKYALGLFDDPYRRCDPDRERSTILNPGFIAQARDAARRSIVLLKNSGNILPLSKNIRSIAVVGPLGDDRIDPLGPWDGLGRAEDVVTLLAGIRSAVSPSTKIVYARGCAIEGDDRGGIAEAAEAAKNADAVILAVGESREMSGEAESRSSLDLPGVQESLLESVTASGKPVVLVLMNGRPLAIPWAAEHVGAILETWFLGVQSGNAIADVLFGDYNPAGKLPATFPRTVGQVPFYYNHKNTGRPADDRERYTSRYRDIPSSPLYPFGFGLSYTTFAYSDVTIAPGIVDSTGTVTITVQVKNSGTRPGEEVVQLYVRQDFGSVTRPVKELKGFQKIMLAPGEFRRVEFSLRVTDLAAYDAQMRRCVEPGTFTVQVGTNSRDVTEGRFTVR